MMRKYTILPSLHMSTLLYELLSTSSSADEVTLPPPLDDQSTDSLDDPDGLSAAGAELDDEGEQEGDNQDANDTDDTPTNQSPDRQGMIRVVPGAQLAYKRKTDDGTFEEMWVYKCEDFRVTTETRRAILSGTDIPRGGTSSEDGKQTYDIWSIGNVEMMKIEGLPG